MRARLNKSLALLLATAGLTAVAGTAIAAPNYEATITRTAFGMPHIKAANFGGLGFGAAYAEAQDNICLMADSYVSSSGERSKYFGANATVTIGLLPGKNIDSDIFYHTMVDSRQLRAAFAKRSADYRQLVDGWVAGYNRFLSDHQGKLPKECAGQAWVRPITLDDALRAINGFTLLSSSANLAAPLANSLPPGAAAAATTPLPVHDAPVQATLGSNGWAFGADATSNGRGLVLGNPHFPWYGPNRFYQMQLTIPGKFNVAGAAITNQPYVGIGFNKDVAWTHTVDTAAHMTLFKLTLDPQDPTVYIVDGKPEKMTRTEVTVAAKDGAPIVRTVYSTRYGPILSLPGTPYAWTAQTAYALRDANRNNVRSGDGYLAIGRATNVRQIREALARNMGAPFINTIAADRHGDAMYADITPAADVTPERFEKCGTISPPIRGQLQRFYILDGSRTSCGWGNSPGAVEPGLLPADRMATIYRRDYVQNSNDSYRWTNPALGKLELGPMMGADPQPLVSMRTRQALQEISAVLNSGRKFDIDLAPQTLFANKSFAWPMIKGDMLKLCERPTAPKDACAVLAGWDGEYEKSSRGAILFELFWVKNYGDASIFAVPFDRNDVVNTPRQLITEGAKGEALLTKLKEAADTMKAFKVPLDISVGDGQYADRGDERIPISGGYADDVLNVTAGLPSPKGFRVFHAASWIQSVTFDDKGPVAKGVLTYSQSTNPASPHYADQTREFSDKKLHTIPFSDAQIEAARISEPLKIRN